MELFLLGEFIDGNAHGVGTCRDATGNWGQCELNHGAFVRWLE